MCRHPLPPTLFYFYIRLPRRRSLQQSHARSLSKLSSGFIIYFSLYITLCIYYILCLSSQLKLPTLYYYCCWNRSQLLLVNPRRDDSGGKIDKIIFLATCLPIIFTHTRLRDRRFQQLLEIMSFRYCFSVLLIVF